MSVVVWWMRLRRAGSRGGLDPPRLTKPVNSTGGVPDEVNRAPQAPKIFLTLFYMVFCTEKWLTSGRQGGGRGVPDAPG